MRQRTLSMLVLAIVLIACARAGAQAVSRNAEDPQTAIPDQRITEQKQAALEKAMQAELARRLVAQVVDQQITEQKKAALEKAVQATIAQETVQRLKIELKAATSGMLGPVVTGAPYSAVVTNESIQTLADGNRIVQRSTYNVMRDGRGRVRREELNEVGGVVSVMIMDPVAKVSYVLDPASRTARKLALLRQKEFVRTSSDLFLTEGMIDRAGAVTIKAAPSWAEAKVTAERMDLRRESLGTQNIEGVVAEGTRTLRTIPAGQIGNERPIEIVAEEWYSKDLQMTVMSRHSDPRTSETTYRVINIRLGEPDPTLFQAPPDYAVTDKR